MVAWFRKSCLPREIQNRLHGMLIVPQLWRNLCVMGHMNITWFTHARAETDVPNAHGDCAKQPIM